MKWEWIVLLCVLTTVRTLDPPNDQRKTSSVPINSNKNSNKPRHKSLRNTNHPTPVIEPAHDAPESYFPDVIYPTSILDVSQPFYFSQPGHDVLAPFSNDVKSSYKTLNSGKGKTSNEYSSKRLEKNNASQNVTVDKNNYTVLSSNDPSNVKNTEVVENTYNVEDNITLNGSGGVHDDIMHQYFPLYNEQPHLNHETLLNVLENVDSGPENMSYNDTREENMEYIHENPTTTPNLHDVVTDDATQELLVQDTQVINPNNGNKTYHVNTNPNYVMTSETGNSHEDFVSDIMNIYSLIEESIRAISVVEFVVSKTLGALGMDDKQNGTNVSEDTYPNVTDGLYNDTAVYENVVDNIFVNNSYKSMETLLEEIEPNSLRSEIKEIGGSTTEELPKCVYNNNYQSELLENLEYWKRQQKEMSHKICISNDRQ